MTMFSFFKKKHRRHTLNFNAIGVDIHSHLIPGVDDGADDIEASVALIKGLRDLGFKKLITTPHIYSDYYPNSSDRLLAGLATVRKELVKQQIDIEISCAAEYFMDDYFESLIEKNDILPLYDNYVLVEMSFFAAPMKLNDYLFKLQTKGYKPILAHPERYTYFEKDFDRFKDLKNRGCKLQLNLLSLTGHYGKAVQDLAEKLLDNKLYDFVGTDTHRMEHVEKLQLLSVFDKENTLLTYQFSNSSFLV
jgi:protein-tyrosine phosphatase